MNHVTTTWHDPMRSIEANTRAGLLEILQKICDTAKSNTSGFHDATGRLRNSISYQLESEQGAFNDSSGVKASSDERVTGSATKLTGVVGCGVSYAAYVENGTRSHAAHPFLAPAVIAHTRGKSAADAFRRP